MLKKLFVYTSLALLSANAAAAGVESGDPKAVPAGQYALDPSHVGVAASVNHLGFSDTVVRFEKVSGTITYDPSKPASSSAEITIDAGSLNSSWLIRDNDLKGAKFFNAAQFPTIAFRSTALKPTGATTAELPGEVTLLGVTRPITLSVTFKGVGKGFDPSTRIGFAASTKIKRSDFGMKAFLPMVGDDVTITINAEFTKKP